MSCFFHFVYNILWYIKILILMKSKTTLFSSCCCSYDVMYKKTFSNPMLWGFTSILSSKSLGL
jgi:hypothetical protein